jgi:hypothetical protein
MTSDPTAVVVSETLGALRELPDAAANDPRSAPMNAITVSD